MNISRGLAIRILKYLDHHPDFYFPFTVVCQEYTEEDDDFVEVEANEWEMIWEDDKYQTFQLWENLQNLDELTLKLMAKGFLERISNESFRLELARRAQQCKDLVKDRAWLLPKSDEYGDSEFFQGKAEAYEDCVVLVEEYTSV